MRKNKRNKYIFLLMFLSFFLFAAPVRAAELEEVLIEPNQDRAEITVTLPEEQQEEITSLRLGFQLKVVKGEPEGVKASFLFAENLPAAVQEYRYQKEKETLYVYLSGREDLFKEQQLSLGTILLESSQEDGAQVSLSLIPDSLELVNQAYGELDVTLAEEPEEFLTVGRGGEPEETPTPDPEATPDPEETLTPTPDPEGTPVPEGSPTPEEGNTVAPTPGNGAAEVTPAPSGGEDAKGAQTKDSQLPAVWAAALLLAASGTALTLKLRKSRMGK